MGKITGKPGQIAPVSGQYQPKHGGHLGQGEVTVVAGHRFPPTQEPDTTFVLVDPTKHKG